MTSCLRKVHESSDLTIQDVLLDLLDHRRCGLTRDEIAVATDTNYTTVTKYVNGEQQPHLEWIAVLGCYVAERYGNYNVARWVAERCLPPEMVLDIDNHK